MVKTVPSVAEIPPCVRLIAAVDLEDEGTRARESGGGFGMWDSDRSRVMSCRACVPLRPRGCMIPAKAESISGHLSRKVRDRCLS